MELHLDDTTVPLTLVCTDHDSLPVATPVAAGDKYRSCNMKVLFTLNGTDVRIRRFTMWKIVRDTLCRGCLEPKCDL